MVVVAVVVVVHVPARVRLRIVVIHHVGEERGEIEKVQRREGGREGEEGEGRETGTGEDAGGWLQGCSLSLSR